MSESLPFGKDASRVRTRRAPADRGPLLEPGFEREQLFSWALMDVNRLFLRAWTRKVQGTGLSSAQWRVLIAVRRNEGLAQTQLAEELEFEKAPLGRLLDRLEAAGLVERRSDPSDRRVKRIFLTDKVFRMRDESLDAARTLFDEALKGLDPKEVGAMTRLLERMKANLLAAEG